ncbi:MAG TPA: hypothetical protein VGG10_15095 [Rhizomicrobium sp.]|jgi:hypothetical protein
MTKATPGIRIVLEAHLIDGITARGSDTHFCFDITTSEGYELPLLLKKGRLHELIAFLVSLADQDAGERTEVPELVCDAIPLPHGNIGIGVIDGDRTGAVAVHVGPITFSVCVSAREMAGIRDAAADAVRKIAAAPPLH